MNARKLKERTAIIEPEQNCRKDQLSLPVYLINLAFLDWFFFTRLRLFRPTLTGFLFGGFYFVMPRAVKIGPGSGLKLIWSLSIWELHLTQISPLWAPYAANFFLLRCKNSPRTVMLHVKTYCKRLFNFICHSAATLLVRYTGMEISER